MNCLPIWDQTMGPLSSIIPPPTAPPLAAAISKEISSFMDSPRNSMHSNHLMLFPADPGLTERAARCSCFNSSNYGAFSVQFGVSEARKLSRGSSSQCFQAKERTAQTRAPSEMRDVELGSGLEDSSVTDPVSATGERNVKMRKATPKRKGKVATENDLNAKKYRSVETTGNVEDDVEPKEDQNGRKRHGKDNGPMDPEPPKDYIHVRARRGQATDSHSLAERVRREKISQRMKLLQDLVPGCNKITGKALMLDEIINYVQSLQRQVEFLSMKLATSTPLVDFKLDSFITKESLLNQANAFMPNSLYNLDNLAGALSFGQLPKEADPLCFNVANTMETHGSMSQLESAFHQTAGIQSFLDIFGDSASQVGDLWDDELRSVIRMGIEQNQEIRHTFDSFHEQLPISHLKLEL